MSITNGMKRIQQLRESLYGPITDDAQMLADYRRVIDELESLPLTTPEEKAEARDFVQTLSQAIYTIEQSMLSPEEAHVGSYSFLDILNSLPGRQ